MDFNGDHSSACWHLQEYVNRTPRNTKLRLPDVFFVSSQTAYLLLRRKEQLSEGEQILVTNLLSKCPQIKTASALATGFKEIMENKKGGMLKRWFKKVVAIGIKELRSLAKELTNDFEAVKNALTLPWSNGQVRSKSTNLKR
jgi:transposase